jgi:tagatose-1,6-bisphosphate aldolase non-catalytic subunit AgaZ/GatZ
MHELAGGAKCAVSGVVRKRRYKITVEHYIVSSGPTMVIHGVCTVMPNSDAHFHIHHFDQALLHQVLKCCVHHVCQVGNHFDQSHLSVIDYSNEQDSSQLEFSMSRCDVDSAA